MNTDTFNNVLKNVTSDDTTTIYIPSIDTTLDVPIITSNDLIKLVNVKINDRLGMNTIMACNNLILDRIPSDIVVNISDRNVILTQLKVSVNKTLKYDGKEYVINWKNAKEALVDWEEVNVDLNYKYLSKNEKYKINLETPSLQKDNLYADYINKIKFNNEKDLYIKVVVAELAKFIKSIEIGEDVYKTKDGSKSADDHFGMSPTQVIQLIESINATEMEFIANCAEEVVTKNQHLFNAYDKNNPEDTITFNPLLDLF